MFFSHVRYNYRVSYIKRIPLYIFLGVLAYIPYHVFLSTWLGSSFGILGSMKVLKDVLVAIGFLLLVFMNGKNKTTIFIKSNTLVQLIGLYAVLTIVIAVFRPTDPDAEVLGVVLNLRYLLFFIYGALLEQEYGERLVKIATKIVLIASIPVVILGLLQVAVLPNNLLTHFGYSITNGTNPAYFVSQDRYYERANSTLKDPNSLGAYLLIILSLITFRLLQGSKRKGYLALLVGATLCLFLTYSRSAWIGAVLSMGAVCYSNLGIRRWLGERKMIMVVSIALMFMLAGIVAMNWQKSFSQGALVHAGGGPQSSNSLRLHAWSDAASKIASYPFGYGPGTAGPASMKNNIQGPVITENYYLQLVIEIGIVGLILFVVINIIVAYGLFNTSKDHQLASALFGSFIGITVANLFLHVWSNEAVAYTWWGLAGLLCYFRTKPTKQIKKNHQQKLPPEV